MAVRALLFDADRTDHEVELEPGLTEGLSDRQLLWIDASGAIDDRSQVRLARLVPAHADDLMRAWSANGGPRLELSGDRFTMRLVALDEADGRRGQPLDILAARNLVITRHPDGLPLLDEIVDHVEGDTTLGQIDSTGFVAAILTAFVTDYLSRVDAVEAAVDRLDSEALRATSRDLLDSMVALRHHIARLRRHLTAHRRVFSALAGADFEAIAQSPATARFQPLADRFQGAIDAVDASREALVGTFDIHMTRTSQRTNEIMKALTVINVLLLPAVVIAGFMGMNEKTPFAEDDPRVFWIVTVLMVVLAVGTLVTLRLRRWL